jgi:glycosyltransferase involved in cell wall biosynthesis
MRVGIDATPLVAPPGGIRRYTESLLHGLNGIDDGNEYVLFGPRADAKCPPLGGRFQWDTVDFPLKGVVDQFRMVGSSGKLDLFHGTNYVAPLWSRSPTVITVHDLTVHLFPSMHPAMRRLRHRLLPRLCHRAARIIADSFNTKSDLVRHFQLPPEKIDVVHLAVGGEFQPLRDARRLDAVRRRYGLPDSFVLFLGTVEPRKNLPRLIDAMKRLAREGVRLPLVIVGDGDTRYVRELRSTIRRSGLELGRDVLMAGYVEDGDLPALYSLCEVFVYPSLYEGFGLPPLEAMACGAPVVVSSNSSLGEFYRDSGLQVDPCRSDLIADAIACLVRGSELRREFAERGLKRARARTWKDVASETVAVYRRAGLNLGGAVAEAI